MKKIIFTLLVVFMSQALTAQTQVFQFEDSKNYCTIEIDTTSLSAVNLGTFRAVELMDVPYYEMAFTPQFEYGENGEKYLIITPAWHYYAYLAKIYGEIENADANDPKFRLKYEFNADESVLTLKTTEEQKRVMLHRSSFSKKKHINFTGFPETMTKTDKIDIDKFPKDLRKDLKKRIDKIKSRLR